MAMEEDDDFMLSIDKLLGDEPSNPGSPVDEPESLDLDAVGNDFANTQDLIADINKSISLALNPKTDIQSEKVYGAPKNESTKCASKKSMLRTADFSEEDKASTRIDAHHLEPKSSQGLTQGDMMEGKRGVDNSQRFTSDGTQGSEIRHSHKSESPRQNQFSSLRMSAQSNKKGAPNHNGNVGSDKTIFLERQPMLPELTGISRSIKASTSKRGSTRHDPDDSLKLPKFSVSPDVSLSFSSLKEALPTLKSGNSNLHILAENSARVDHPGQKNVSRESKGESKNDLGHSSLFPRSTIKQENTIIQNNNELEHLRISVKESEKELELLRKSSKLSSNELVSLRKTMEEWKAKVSDRDRKISGLEDKVKLLSEQNKTLRCEKQEFKEQLEQKAKMYRNLDNEMQKLMDEKAANIYLTKDEKRAARTKMDTRKLIDEIERMENLIQSLNKENQRLHDVIKMHGKATKDTEDNFEQKLGALRMKNETLEQQVLSYKGAGLRCEGEATNAIAKEAKETLNRERKTHEKRVMEMKYEIDKLRKEKLDLETQTGINSRDVQKENEYIRSLENKLNVVTELKEEEIRKLQTKLKWYIENQSVIDELVEIRKNDKEKIIKLEEKIELLHQKPRTEKKRGNLKQQKRIKELESLVEDLQAMIKKKRPDSMMAMIHAAQPSVEEEKMVITLKEEIKSLKVGLREKEHQMEIKVRSLKQMHDQTKMLYEDKIKELQQKKKTNSSEKIIGTRRKDSRIKQLEKQLSEMRSYYKKKMEENGKQKPAENLDFGKSRGDDAMNKLNQKIEQQHQIIEELKLDLKAAREEGRKGNGLQPVAVPAAVSAAVYNAEEREKFENRMSRIENVYKVQLKSVTESCETRIRLLKDHLEDTKTSSIAAARGLNEELRLVKAQLEMTSKEKRDQEKKLTDLEHEMNQLRKTPYQAQIERLKVRIKDIENLQYAREREMQSEIEELELQAKEDVKLMQNAHKKQLNQKDNEIRRFRRELDEILKALYRMQRCNSKISGNRTSQNYKLEEGKNQLDSLIDGVNMELKELNEDDEATFAIAKSLNISPSDFL